MARHCEADPRGEANAAAAISLARRERCASRSEPERCSMVNLKVNGRQHDLDIDPDTPLLYALRDDLRLNGAKYGCGLGQCGSCTVMVDGEPAFSCLVPVMLLEGKEI